MQVRRKSATLAVGVTLGVVGALVLAGPVQADDQAVLPVEPWHALDSGEYASADSHIVDPWTANLVVAEGNDNAQKGTSLETTNLGLHVEAGAEVAFEYESLHGADCDDGANVRVFVISNGDTVNSWDQNQPDGTQCGENGVVTFTISEAGTIGHAGLVYDNDPPAPGTIQFRNLTIDGTTVLFADVCQWDETIGAASEDCVEPTDQTDETDGSDETDGGTAGEDALPTTGTYLGGLAIMSAGLISAGLAFVVVSHLRRRRTEFIA